MAIERLGVTVKKGLFVFPLNESENKIKQDGRIDKCPKVVSVRTDHSRSVYKNSDESR